MGTKERDRMKAKLDQVLGCLAGIYLNSGEKDVTIGVSEEGCEALSTAKGNRNLLFSHDSIAGRKVYKVLPVAGLEGSTIALMF